MIYKGEISSWNIECSQSDELIKSIYIKRKYHEDFDIFMKNDINDYWPIKNKVKNLDLALDLCINAIKNNSTIGIVGDYDADGIIATSLLISFFNQANIKYKYKIPNRFIDGYGITPNILKELDTQIIITVDNGTSAYEAIDMANNNNINLIILDHHTINRDIEVKAFVNPCQDNSIYEIPCAAGLTFIFLYELNLKLKTKINMYQFVDKVAVATVCDCVNMRGFNRAIVKIGIEKINKQPSLAFKYMITSDVNEITMGYYIGPCINATGRFGKAEYAINLLISEDEKEVEILTAKIGQLNIDRKVLDKQIYQEALIQESFSFCKVFFGKWHEGVIGIVAGRLAQKYNAPVIVMSENENNFKASARSIANFNIAGLIKKGIELNIIKFGGGHAMAGGFTLQKSKLDLFLNFIYEYSESMTVNTDLLYNVDSVISLHSINVDLYNQIIQLGPFGINNNIPYFCIPNCIITSTKVISYKHLLVYFTDQFKTKTLSSIIFDFINSKLQNIPVNKIICLFVTLSIYKKNISINICDYYEANKQAILSVT